jgi:hypothetical protein
VPLADRLAGIEARLSALERAVGGDCDQPTRKLIERLLALSEMAVGEVLELDYGDPEDRYIWRELQELKALAAARLASDPGQLP